MTDRGMTESRSFLLSVTGGLTVQSNFTKKNINISLFSLTRISFIFKDRKKNIVLDTYLIRKE